MIGSTSSSTGAATANQKDYRRAFLAHVHCLLQSGYLRLDARKLVAAEEPDITGKLVEAIKDLMNDPNAPTWVDNYAVADDPPIEDGKRRGKGRCRLDIQFESSAKRPRPTMSFEAKRLEKRYTIGLYLGTGGLGCFLRGDYAADEPDVGMIGYVQEETLEHWISQLKSQLSSRSAALKVRPGTSLEAYPFPGGPTNTQRSEHDRPAPLGPLTVYHSFLQFF